MSPSCQVTKEGRGLNEPFPPTEASMQNAFCQFSCSEVCAGLGNGCERFARRDLC